MAYFNINRLKITEKVNESILFNQSFSNMIFRILLKAAVVDFF
tara:strand:+ start:514 stop:642 length:129 start_codon:yes stop_codon:yes gene_type:complete